MEQQCKTHHWIYTRFKYNQNNIFYAIFNIYMLNNPIEKVECWNTLHNLSNSFYSQNNIITVDLNIIRNNTKKRGGIYGRHPFRDNMEELILEWDLLDIPPQLGKFTWSNMRARCGHIATRLDWILVNNNFLNQNASIKSYILPSLISNHKPISLHLKSLSNYVLMDLKSLDSTVGSKRATEAQLDFATFNSGMVL